VIRPGIDFAAGRPAVCADNHYDAVPTPPKHRGSYGSQSVNLPKDLHANAAGRCTNWLREGTLMLSSIPTERNNLKTSASHHAQTLTATFSNQAIGLSEKHRLSKCTQAVLSTYESTSRPLAKLLM